ncbi:MAG: peptidase [Chlorobiota bacterium]
MQRTGFIITLFLLVFGAMNAQDGKIFIQREFQNAVKKGTRTLDGVPGPNYWRNSADYKLKASLETVTGKIKGTGMIEYRNESPDDLKNLTFNLQPDIYKKGAQRNIAIDPDDAGDGMVINELKVNGTPFPAANIQRIKGAGLIKLPEPLKSKQKLTVEVSWEFTMPRTPDPRIGTYGDSAYFVAYWYPQIAVYDDIHGWDALGYEGEHEFYTTAGNFEVELTVPNGILVWATGTLQNRDEIFTKDALKKIDGAAASETPVVICEPSGIKNMLMSGTSLTWKFKADMVPDVSFCVSNNRRWEAVGLPLSNGKNVMINSVYVPGVDSLTPEVVTISRHIMKYFSEVFPGVPYPYEHMTLFNGSGGMEFPMMVNQDTENDRWLATYVTTHEIAHTYFPFMTGTNEKRYSWLDEGMAVYLPLSEQTKLYWLLRYDESTTATLNRTMGTQMDIPLMIPSYNVTGPAHMIGAYGRSGMAFLILEDIIGKDVMQNSLKGFIETWQHKHPTPYDFFFYINKSTGKSLESFWNAWYFDQGFPDLALKDAGVKSSRKIEVVKIGHYPIPVRLEVEFTDDSKETITRSAEVWLNGEKSLILEIPGKKEIKSVKLGSPKFPDVDATNNTLSF